MKQKTKKQIRAALIRAIRTIAQTAVAAIGTQKFINEIQWEVIISTSLLAGVLSILMSIAGLPECVGNNCEEVE